MACYCPRKGWMARERTANGKRPITFRWDLAWTDQPVEVPCGGCIGCKLDRAKEWASRCTHEMEGHKHTTFVTLTYDDDHLPENGSLRPRDMVLFLKRLRKMWEPETIRFFQCGEYGETTQRPHHHALLFGVLFPDRVHAGTTANGPHYRSKILEQLWPHGQSSLCDATTETANYIARYTVKKLIDKKANPDDPRVPEYLTMSKGIGKNWADKWAHINFRDGYFIRNGVKHPIPRYYEQRAIAAGLDKAVSMCKTRRQQHAELTAEHRIAPRQDAGETIRKAKSTRLKRNL